MAQWRPISEAFSDPRVTEEQRTLFVARFGQESQPSFNCVFFDDDPVSSGAGQTYPWCFSDGGGAYHYDWPTHWMLAEDAALPPLTGLAAEIDAAIADCE